MSIRGLNDLSSMFYTIKMVRFLNLKSALLDINLGGGGELIFFQVGVCQACKLKISKFGACELKIFKFGGL